MKKLVFISLGLLFIAMHACTSAEEKANQEKIEKEVNQAKDDLKKLEEASNQEPAK
jgi:hypothetical protein